MMALGMASIVTVTILWISSVSYILSNHRLESFLMNPSFATPECEWR